MPPLALDRVLHAGLLALYDQGVWKGALIQGPSGVGKSDLALRAAHAGFRLVADDRTLVWVSQGRLFGACPPAIAGLIEARGVGVARLAAWPLVEIRLAVRCLGPLDEIERYPEERRQTVLDMDIPVIDVRPLEASAPQKILHALSLLGAAR